MGDLRDVSNHSFSLDQLNVYLKSSVPGKKEIFFFSNWFYCRFIDDSSGSKRRKGSFPFFSDQGTDERVKLLFTLFIHFKTKDCCF